MCMSVMTTVFFHKIPNFVPGGTALAWATLEALSPGSGPTDIYSCWLNKELQSLAV